MVKAPTERQNLAMWTWDNLTRYVAAARGERSPKFNRHAGASGRTTLCQRQLRADTVANTHHEPLFHPMAELQK